MRSAKTELEKIDFKKITCREAIKEVARMYVPLFFSLFSSASAQESFLSIYKFHDDIKEKDFEVELSWVSEESGRSASYCIAPSPSFSPFTLVLSFVLFVAQHLHQVCFVSSHTAFYFVQLLLFYRKHQFVPEELRAEAVRIAQELKKKEEMDDSDDDDEKE